VNEEDTNSLFFDTNAVYNTKLIKIVYTNGVAKKEPVSLSISLSVKSVFFLLYSHFFTAQLTVLCVRSDSSKYATKQLGISHLGC
jgi:hypothetical protein